MVAATEYPDSTPADVNLRLRRAGSALGDDEFPRRSFLEPLQSGMSGVSFTMRTWQMTGERSEKLRDGSGRNDVGVDPSRAAESLGPACRNIRLQLPLEH